MTVINQTVTTSTRQPSEAATLASHSGRTVSQPTVTHVVTAT